MQALRWLYHILGAAEGLEGGSYAPAGYATEGFIHASFQPDVLESARLFFPADAALEVVQIDPRLVPYEVVATDRGPMPHILAVIPRGAIAARFPLADAAGAADVLSVT